MMRKLITALILGSTTFVVAAPALGDEFPNRRIQEQLRERKEDRRERAQERRERREDRWERREERRDDRRDRWEDRRERWEDRRDDRDRREHWDDGRRNDWQRYGYRYDGTPWNRQWTPYGFGYNDSFTRDWVLRNFADRNRNGRISEGEWRRAQSQFYYFADRNRDGRISRSEYEWAQRALRSNYGYRW